MNKSLVGLILGLVLPLLAACGGAKEVEVEKSTPSLPAVEARRLQAEPAGVQDVIDLKAKAKVGDQVVVFGRVRKFSDGFASFVLTGSAMRHCAERDADGCPTPWDYCCETPTDLAAHSLNVEFREGDRPIRGRLDGVGGLKLLADVVVEGKVAAVEDGNVTISAEGYWLR